MSDLVAGFNEPATRFILWLYLTKEERERYIQ
jgi:hypothetical protein